MADKAATVVTAATTADSDGVRDRNPEMPLLVLQSMVRLPLRLLQPLPLLLTAQSSFKKCAYLMDNEQTNL